MFQLEKALKEGGSFRPLIQSIRDGQSVSAFGLPFAARTAVASLFDGFLYLTADFVAARAAADQLACLMEGVVFLPARDDVLTYRQGQSGENASARLRALCEIASGRARAVVTTVEAAAQLYPEREAFFGRVITVERGGEYDLSDLSRRLSGAGYKRVSQIEGAGQYALRGDILDVWPVGGAGGVRVEFFGDEAESIRYVDAEDQTSSAQADRVEICPGTDIFIGDEGSLLSRLRADKPDKLEPGFEARLSAILGEIEMRVSGGDRSVSLACLMPYLPHTSLAGFVRPKLVIFDECKTLESGLKVVYTEHRSRYKMLLSRGEAVRGAADALIGEDEVFSFGAVKLAFHKITTANRIFDPQAVYSYNVIEAPDYTRNLSQLPADAKTWSERGYRVVVCCGSEEVRAHAAELFSEAGAHYSLSGEGSVLLTADRLTRGAVFHEDKLALIGTHDLVVRAQKKVIRRSKKDVFTEPQVGDYVVHNVHGIGVCESIEKLEALGAKRDYLVIRYLGGDKLYVPVENMDSLSKYVAGDKPPELSKIGGAGFAKVKERIKASVKAMAVDLLKLYALRGQTKGHRYNPDNTAMREFAEAFPFDETDDQLTAIADGLKDLTDGKIMDRLLCGDVGYGKTEVALRIAYKVILEGKQVAFLSPTTILASQHYNTVVRRMEPFGVNVARLTRFDTGESLHKTLSGLKSGQVDIVCGTHRLLGKDVAFFDLGLLILDEEQRFGVADKEKIKTVKQNVNVLTLSATPIPRTLHMSMTGVRDISVLDTPPADRIPIQTYVSEYSDTLVTDAVLREAGRGGQVFIVYNRVATIDKYAAELASLLPDLKIAVAHGQMQQTKLEKTIEAFTRGESDVLVASTIIENGIDMPRANTMIVVDSDRLGLAQLYQLRGRVGRSNRLAYVFFTYDGKKVLTEDAYKRLDAITQFTEFGSGFKIAMRDLEIRGAGNVLGREQHGHMEKVGYDMYCKLLSEAVEELKGNQVRAAREVKVIVDYNAFIPEGYIADNEWRLRLYGRISRLTTAAEREELMRDMRDIYGPVPDSVANLLTVALVKNLAAKIGAATVTLKKSESLISFDKVKDMPEAALSASGGVLKLAKMPIISFKSNADLVNFLLKC